MIKSLPKEFLYDYSVMLRASITKSSFRLNGIGDYFGSSKRTFFNSTINSQKIITKINNTTFCGSDCDCNKCQAKGKGFKKFKRFITIDHRSKDVTSKGKKSLTLNNSDNLNNLSDSNESGIKSYCKEVYTNVAKFLGVTAASGAVGYGVVSSMFPYLGGSGLTVAVGAWLFCAGGSFYQVYQLTKDNKTEEERLQHAYKMHTFMGLVITPSLLIFHDFIPLALVGTAALTAGPIMLALNTPSKSLLPYGSALYSCLGGLVGIGLTSLIAPLLGFESLGLFAHNIDLYGGVLLFTLYNAYDTHKMLDDYEKGDRDVLFHATNYSLSAINIFIRLLEILSKAQKK